MKNTAKEIFCKSVNGKNFCTPDILCYEYIKHGAVELSVGKIMGSIHYGVTVVINGKLNTDLSTTFTTKKQALNYIGTLK